MGCVTFAEGEGGCVTFVGVAQGSETSAVAVDCDGGWRSAASLVVLATCCPSGEPGTGFGVGQARTASRRGHEERAFALASGSWTANAAACRLLYVRLATCSVTTMKRGCDAA